MAPFRRSDFGADPFGQAFESVDGKKIKGRSEVLEIQRLASDASLEDLQACDLLFVCASEVEQVPRIVEGLKGQPILLVSEMEGFIEKGGMINLVERRSKIRWEINQEAVKATPLRLQSMLFKSALRVIK